MLLQVIFSWGSIQNWIKMNSVVILLLTALTCSAANGLYKAEFVSLFPELPSPSISLITIWFKLSQHSSSSVTGVLVKKAKRWKRTVQLYWRNQKHEIQNLVKLNDRGWSIFLDMNLVTSDSTIFLKDCQEVAFG